MQNTLDYTQAEFWELLDQTTEIILQQYTDLDAVKGFHYFPQQVTLDAEIETMNQN